MASITTQTLHVPHLGGITVSYHLARPHDPSKPTVLLVNSFTTSAALYHRQFQNTHLCAAANLLAVELLGHGGTRAEGAEQWTYWDTAVMNIQVMDALGIEKAFVCGTSQGGWITVRMALLAPDRIEGIIPLGTSMDYESERTRSLGCWDGHKIGTDVIKSWTLPHPTPTFQPDDAYCTFLIDIGFGKACDPAVRGFWTREIKKNYSGEDGRRRARMAAINLRDRDGLHGRLFDVKCPVLWIHGTDDVVYSVANAEEEIKLFVSSVDAQLLLVKGGQHFLSSSNPDEVDAALIAFVQKWHNAK